MMKGRQAGVALVAAIFLMVTLSLLSVYILQLGGTQRATSVFSLQGARAYHAAKSAVEYGIYEALNNAVATCGGAPSSSISQNISFTEGGLQGFTADLSCEYSRHEESGDCFNVYVIDVFASKGTYGNANFASRNLQTTLTDHVNGSGGCP